jgi:hypothetical protein
MSVHPTSHITSLIIARSLHVVCLVTVRQFLKRVAASFTHALVPSLMLGRSISTGSLSQSFASSPR